MTRFDIINQDIHRLLGAYGYSDGSNFSTFTRPDDHLIIEAFAKDRDAILSILKKSYTVVENDSWCGGNRLGIIVPHMWDNVDQI